MKEVEIFDEENSLTIDDKYDITNFTFYPENRKFEVSRSVKDDCFFSTQIFEYRVSSNPIGLQMRTLESSHEPPMEYWIKDGVVLESELRKNTFASSRIEELKKSVEWNGIPIFGNYEVNLYLLSKHPDLISKEEYRRFLRQSLERLKVGVARIEEVVKTDTQKLKIYSGEYGKNIWYLESESDKAEEEKYWNLPDDKKIDSEYSKKLEYVEKLKKSIFEENSIKYVGVTEYEFRDSVEIIEYIEKLLDKREAIYKKAESVPEHVSNNKNKWFLVAALSFIALYWGIWTAVGSFILGAIIINILSRSK